MKKRLLLLLILLALLLFIGWRFWQSRATQSPTIVLPQAVASQILLTEMHGTVEVQVPDRPVWQAAIAGMDIASGSHVRTGADGSATIQILDQSENRLAANTEVTVTATPAALDHPGRQVGWQIATGRMWSRVLRLLDVHDDYSISTTDAIATVRGTAFAVEKMNDHTQFSLLHGALDTGAAGFLPDRWTWTFANGTGSAKGLVSDAWFNDSWVIMNRVKDEQYAGNRLQKDPSQTTAADRLYARFLGLDQQFDAVFDSEALIPLINPDVLTKLTASVGEADQALRDLPTETDKTIQDKLARKLAALKTRLEALLSGQSMTKSSVPPVEGATSTLPAVKPTPVQSAPVVTKPVTNPIVPTRFSCSSLMVTATPSLPRVGERATILVQALQSNQQYTDVSKTAALSVTDKAGVLNGTTLTMIREGSTYVEARLVCDGQTLVGRTFVKTAAATPMLQSLEISADRYTLTTGERSQLTAYAVFSDGSQKEVSANAAFAVSDPGIGSMNGRIFYANGRSVGTETITVSYGENGKAVSQKLQITVRAASLTSGSTNNLLQ